MSWRPSVENSDEVESYEIHHIDPRSRMNATELLFKDDFDGKTNGLVIGSKRLPIQNFPW